MFLVVYFLYGNQKTLLFKYIGLFVGVNPLLEVTWEQLVSFISICLFLWKHKYVGLGDNYLT